MDAFQVGLDVEVVVVTLLLDAMQSFFELILAVGNKTRVLGSPSRM
jgi:hypothetical protein